MKYQKNEFVISRLEFIMQLHIPALEYFLGSCKWNQISTPASFSASLQSGYMYGLKPVPASNTSPESILLQFQLITISFIDDGCGNLTKLSLQIPFKKYFLQTKTSIFSGWKTTLAGVCVFFFPGEVPQTTLYSCTVWQQKKDLLPYSRIKYSHALKKQTNTKTTKQPTLNYSNFTDKDQAFKFKASMMKKLTWPTYQVWQLAGSDRTSELPPVIPAGNFLKLLYVSPAYVWWNTMHKNIVEPTNPFFPNPYLWFLSFTDFFIFFTDLVTQP